MRKITSLLLFLLCANVVVGQIIPPHVNTFDNVGDTIGWTHYAIYGIDDWELGSPSKVYFNSAYSGSNAWVTNLDSNYYSYSVRILETPYYDLTDTTSDLILSFYQKRKSVGSHFYYLEYSTNHGNSWQLLDNATSLRKNWQTSSGFIGNSYNFFVNSVLDIKFLQGQDSVKFRFRYESSNGSDEGWMIDDFAIKHPESNVTATIGDSITGINKYFTNITVVSDFIFQNQFANPVSFQNDFYVSNDTNIDSSDIFLGSFVSLIGNTFNNWSTTISLPSGLAAGSYYVLYKLDATDTLLEFNENDNESYAVLIIDSIFNAPYISSFDSVQQEWNASSSSMISLWNRGDPNGWHLEDPRSGTNAWYSTYNSGPALESPYLDLSSSVNTTLCFWFRDASPLNYVNTSLTISLPNYNGSTVAEPYFPPSKYYVIPSKNLYTWNCYCKDISDYDGEISTKIRIRGGGQTGPSVIRQAAIDDIYIGESKPDVAIEGFKTNRFTNSFSSTDTLNYMIFNSGLSSLISTTTEFYWSTDSLLDASDIFLGTNIEPALGDTSFQWNQFYYTKPNTNPGKYYIIYKADAQNQVNEMREYDNIGFFELYQEYSESLPYYNDFETTISKWRHNASLGNDDWVWGEPHGIIIDTTYSGTKAFITNDSGNVSFKSRMHLYTPIFDLTQLQNPIMEFDLFAYYTFSPGHFPKNMGNIMYSIDGGSSWIVLEPNNSSFKRMYSALAFQKSTGQDNYSSPANSISELMYGKNLKWFRTYFDYQGRDYDYENHQHNVVDLSFLQNHQQVQFMFVYANHFDTIEGMLIDNFEIREKSIDLVIPDNKNLMVSSIDNRLKFHYSVKNNDNYISSSSQVRYYCSVDTILDASDVVISTRSISAIEPYKKHFINVDESTPNNYNTYNYLIIEIDPFNIIQESNESNNIKVLKLNMDTASNYSYPVLFDFADDYVDGWTWYNDGTGVHNSHRFRNKLVMYDHFYNIQNGQSGELFLDQIQNVSTNLSNYPVNYILSPPFDFTSLANISLEFDFLCVGKQTTTNPGTQGGNMEYSTNGGLSWTLLTKIQDPNAQNWYNSNDNVSSLNNEPGWLSWQNWTHAKYNLSFLSGYSSVRFRYKFKSINMLSSLSNHGFRLDNFKISGSQITSLQAITICQGDSALIFNNYQSIAGNYYDTIPAYLGGDSILLQPLLVTLVDTSITISGNLLSSNAINASYQWINCDSNYMYIAGAINQNYNVTVNGNYAIEITKNGCIDTSSCYSIIAIGVNEVINDLGILIYPNPNTGLFTIEKSSELDKKVNISLLDASSRVIIDKLIPKGQQKIEMDITSYSKGVYYLQLTVGKEVFVKKILKN